MTISEMTKEIAKLAPITGITATGRIDFLPEASQAQREAAQSYLAAHFTEINEVAMVKILSKLLIVDRLIAAGKIEAAIAALNADPVGKFRWDAAQEIASNDPQVRAFLAVIGANPDEILA